MYFKQLLSSAIAFLFVFNGLIESKEFCQAFKNNNNSISYVFDWKYTEIIIDGHYWRLNIFLDPSNNYLLDSVSFMDQSLESKECPLFTSSYSMAVYNELNQENQRAYLFDKNDWKQVVKIELPVQNKKGVDDLSDYKIVERTALEAYPNTKLPNNPIAIYKYFNGPIVFIDGQLSGTSHRYYLLDYLRNQLKAWDNPKKSFAQLYPFFNFDSKYRFVGVFAFLRINWTQNKMIIESYVVLQQEQQRILWCYLNPELNFTLQKCISDPNELIDCKDVSKPETSKSTLTLILDIRTIIIIIFMIVMNVIITI